VYQGDKLVNYDKYRGRALDVDGVKQGLREFLHNGTHLLVPLINSIISRLRQLKEVIVRHDTFRFYSSSLLVIYDGCDWSNYGSASSDVHSQCTDGDSCDSTSRSMSASPIADHNKVPEPTEGDDWSQVAAAYKFDVRMIDFAHVTFRGFNERDTAHDGPDHGYLYGLDKLIETLTEISDNDKQITG
jgi:inositol-hexakisphosphate kinase